MPKRVLGDPLTGVIPKTQLILLEEARPPRPRRWPLVPDPMAVTKEQMSPGMIAFVRTRRGLRKLMVRTVRVSRQRPNRGRHYFVGMTRTGRCYSYWLDRVASVMSPQQALTAGRQLKAIGPGR